MSRWDPHHSAMLSLLLDDVTGNENAVSIRRDYCQILEFLLPLTIYYTGSKSEGLDLPGSDVDLMGDFNGINFMKVVQSWHELHGTSFFNVFLLSTENVNPGFAFLCCINEQIDHPLLVPALQCINGVQYLSSDLMVNNIMPIQTFILNNMINGTFKRQGPSMETRYEYQDQSEESVDLVMSLHCQFWPNDASEWIRRPRHHGWPTPHVISTIVDFGCHLVPIGHPNSETKNLEWRISFSVAERKLVWTFNHVQIQCYAVMKIILKEFIKKRCSAQHQILCSYFIKTFLFWKYEETDMNFWCKNNLRECIKYLMTEFSQCIYDGVLRHYFLPQFNLLAVKLTRAAQSELLQLCDIIIQCDISILKECKTLKRVWSKFLFTNDNQMDIIHNENKNNLIKNDELMMKKFTEIYRFYEMFSNEIMPEANNGVTNILNKLNINVPLVHNLISEVMPKLMSYFMPKQLTFHKNLNHLLILPCKTSLKSFVVKQLRVQKHIEASVLDQSNKILYNLQRAVHDNAWCNLSTNKLWCAIVHLKRCEYTATLSIINQVLSSVPQYALYESASDCSESKRLYVNAFLSSSCTVMERAKKAWIIDTRFHRYMIKILPFAVQIELNHITDMTGVIGISLSQFTCAYYLMFLCYHELGQYDNRHRALQQLIEVANNPEQCGRTRHHSYNIAGHCLLMTGERDRALDMFNRSIQFARCNRMRDKYNAARWYIRKLMCLEFNYNF